MKFRPRMSSFKVVFLLTLICAIIGLSVSDTSTCSKRCAKKFGQCHKWLKKNQGKTDSEAYTLCRRRIDNGNFDKKGCVSKCTDTEDMKALNGNDDGPVSYTHLRAHET